MFHPVSLHCHSSSCSLLSSSHSTSMQPPPRSLLHDIICCFSFPCGYLLVSTQLSLFLFIPAPPFSCSLSLLRADPWPACTPHAIQTKILWHGCFFFKSSPGHKTGRGNNICSAWQLKRRKAKRPWQPQLIIPKGSRRGTSKSGSLSPSLFQTHPPKQPDAHGPSSLRGQLLSDTQSYKWAR